MSRRKQSRPQPFKQFLEDRRSNTTEDNIERSPADDAKDEEDSNHDNTLEYTLPTDFMVGASGLVAAAHITANKVFGPFQGSVVKVDPEANGSEENQNKSVTATQHISDSEGALYDLSVGGEETGCDQRWLTQLASAKETCNTEDANMAIQSQDGKLYLRSLDDIPEGCILKAMYQKEESRRGIKRQRSNGTYVDHEELPEVNHKKINTATLTPPKTPEADTANPKPVTSSETTMTSSPREVTSSSADAASTITVSTAGTESFVEVSSSSGSAALQPEAVTEAVAQVPLEGMERGPPYNCQHCCIEFRNPDNLEAHKTYYCPTTATQPLPASMRRVPPGANTVIKRRNRTPKQVKNLPYQMRSTTPPSNNNTEEKTPGTYVCQLCQSSFTNHTNCESHMLLLHCDETVNLCKFCNFIAPTLATLKVHVFTHVKYFVSSASNSPRSDSESQGSPEEFVQGGTAVRIDETAIIKATEVTDDQGVSYKREDLRVHSSSEQIKTDVQSTSKKKQDIIYQGDTPPSSSNGKPSIVLVENTSDESKHDPLKRTQPSEDNSENNFKCGHCDFKTSTKNVFESHMNQHRLPVLKIPSAVVSPGNISKGNRVISPNLEQEEAPNKCHECNIVFMSRQNYVAHKQFYCASRHSQSPPNLPSQVNIGVASTIANATTTPEHFQESVHQMSLTNSQTPTSPKSGRSSVNSHSNLTSPKADRHNPAPRSSSNCSSHSTPSPLPTMVQLSGPCPPISSQSSSPALTSPPPYIIPAGSVLSGMTQQGAPVLLVAVPYPTAGVRRDDQATSSHMSPLQIRSPPVASGAHMEEEKPLDLSVKTSKASPETATSPTASSETSPKGPEEQIPPAAVIDLSSTIQTNLQRPPPVEQLNECKKCDIVFNKYESLVAHKQYYCASRHMRGRQIEMSYRQGGECSGNQASSSKATSDEEEKGASPSLESNKVQLVSEKPFSHEAGIEDHSVSTGPTVADKKPFETKLGLSKDMEGQQIVIKHEQGNTSDQKVVDSDSTACSKTESSVLVNSSKPSSYIGGSQGDRNVENNICNSSNSEQEVDRPKTACPQWVALKPYAVQDDVKPSVSPTGVQQLSSESRVGQHDSHERAEAENKEQTSSKEFANVEGTFPAQRPPLEVSGSTIPIMEAPIGAYRRPYSCQACTVSFMKLESLEVHQKFYCAARRVTDSPQPSFDINTSKDVSVAKGPERNKDKSDSNKVTLLTQNGTSTVQRDPLLCKGCDQYFATSKQVRRHSCKNGANQNNLGKAMAGAQKRSSQEQSTSSSNAQDMVDVDVPPNKRCKSDSVIKICPDLSRHQSNGVIIKQEYIETSDFKKSSSDEPKTDMSCEVNKITCDSNTEQMDASSVNNEQSFSNVMIKREYQSDSISGACHNGDRPVIKEEVDTNSKFSACHVSKTEISRQVTDNITPVTSSMDAQNDHQDTRRSSRNVLEERSSYRQNTNVSCGVSDTESNSKLAFNLSGTLRINNAAEGNARLKTGPTRISSGANLSSRGRVIQQPPAKHCSTCNIDFNSLSNFIAHKKYYCSARQQTKS